MLNKLIEYFAKRHLLTNFLCFGVIIGGIFAWGNISKEEYPDITFDRMSIRASYPGASAEDVEQLLTRPIEDALKGTDGIYRVTSVSSVGSSNVTVELEHRLSNRDEVITEIKNSVFDADLPEDMRDDPRFRIFKTSRKAIIDIGIIDTSVHFLDTNTRRKLQTYAFALESQLQSLPEVHSVSRQGYLKEEIKIEADPKKLTRYRIPFNTVMREIKNNNVRRPAGSIEHENEAKVTLTAELDTIEKLEGLAIQGGFEGHVVRLGQIAEITKGFEKSQTVIKINGHEGIFLNVVKNSSYGILDALEAVQKAVERFKKNNLAGTDIQIVLLDDESTDIRNRLSLIKINGAIGLVFILISLFIFLNFKSSIWVAFSIPFTFCFTMLALPLFGYTINNITLAAVIIVMGMVVDDAIIVAENVTRLRQQGHERWESVISGTTYVFMPITASIITTCVAFIPLYYFTGRFGMMINFIPLIIFLMLGASLLESLFILPGHLNLKFPKLGSRTSPSARSTHWFTRVEEAYGRAISRVLRFKWAAFLVFAVLVALAVFIFNTRMKFVMFPNEETRQISLTAEAPKDTKRYETARLAKSIEEMLTPYIGKEVVGFRTSVARSRRSHGAQENRMRMRIEIVPKDDREISASGLVEKWKKELGDSHGFEKLNFRKGWFGHSSGSPIEIIIQENKDSTRKQVVEALAKIMEEYPALKNVEIDRPMYTKEYKVDLKRDKIKRLGISPVDIGSTFRAILEGSVLYKLINGDEPIYVRFTAADNAKMNMESILDIPVENRGKYLVPLRDVVIINKVESPSTIARQDFRRTTIIDADIEEEAKQTPLDIAAHFEEEVFPKLMSEYPSTLVSFGGEVKESRESKRNFMTAIITTVVLIYIVLALLFNSLIRPFIIMLVIPFGAVGVILAFWAHGMTLFGFFSVIGVLGLAGVVINDSIVMLVKLDREYDSSKKQENSNTQIADIAKTRLRAVVLTTITTVAGLLPTAYGFAGYDSMLAEMMLAMAWGLIFGTTITLILVPCVYSVLKDISYLFTGREAAAK